MIEEFIYEVLDECKGCSLAPDLKISKIDESDVLSPENVQFHIECDICGISTSKTSTIVLCGVEWNKKQRGTK